MGGEQSRARASKDPRVPLSTQEPLRGLSKIAIPEGAIVRMILFPLALLCLPQRLVNPY